jgi:hypothetical protein
MKDAKTIVAEAVELRAEERAAFLDRACAGDSDLRAAVEEMLGHSGTATVSAETTHPEATAVLDATLDFDSSIGQLPTPSLEREGSVIGRYKLVRQIGEGGCGTVFLAEQEKPVRRQVALKVIKLGMDTRSVVFALRGRTPGAGPDGPSPYRQGVGCWSHRLGSAYWAENFLV